MFTVYTVLIVYFPFTRAAGNLDFLIRCYIYNSVRNARDFRKANSILLGLMAKHSIIVFMRVMVAGIRMGWIQVFIHS